MRDFLKDLIHGAKDLILHAALQNGDACEEEIKRQQELSAFAADFPDLAWTKALLERLGLGMIVRVYRTTSTYECHLYSDGEKGQAYALFEFINGNHVQAPALIPRKRAIEVRARCQCKCSVAPQRVLTVLCARLFPRCSC